MERNEASRDRWFAFVVVGLGAWLLGYVSAATSVSHSSAETAAAALGHGALLAGPIILTFWSASRYVGALGDGPGAVRGALKAWGALELVALAGAAPLAATTSTGTYPPAGPPAGLAACAVISYAACVVPVFGLLGVAARVRQRGSRRESDRAP